MSELKIDVLMGTSLDDLERQCRERIATGVDGLFTFEGQHDPFLPLAIAARTVEADLMTNVAIAFPRSPMQLANVAYDLQVLSGGQFRLGLGLAGEAGDREALRCPVVTAGAAHAGVGVGDQGDLRRVGGHGQARLPRRVHDPHADDAELQPRSEPVRPTAGADRCARPADDRGGGRGRRRRARDAVQQRPAPRGAHRARHRARASEGWPAARGRGGDLRGDRLRRPHRGTDGGGDAWREGTALLLRVHPVVQAGARRGGVGRPAAGAQPVVEAGRVGDDVDAHRRRRVAHHRGGRHARGVRAADRRTLRRHRVARVSCYFPGYEIPPVDLAALVDTVHAA